MIEEFKEKIKTNKKVIMFTVIAIICGMLLFTFDHPNSCKITIPSPDKPILQIILSPECPHCQIANSEIFKDLDILSDKYVLNPIYVGNIDSQKLKIVGVPTFILYKNGIEVKRAVGFLNTTTLITELEEK